MLFANDFYFISTELIIAPITGASNAPPKNSNNHNKTKKVIASEINPIGIATQAAAIPKNIQKLIAFGFSYPPGMHNATVNPPKTTPAVGPVI